MLAANVLIIKVLESSLNPLVNYSYLLFNITKLICLLFILFIGIRLIQKRRCRKNRVRKTYQVNFRAPYKFLPDAVMPLPKVRYCVSKRLSTPA